MTDAFEIRRVSPAHPPKSGCGVPPQSVRDASRPHSSSSFQRFSFQNFSFCPTALRQQSEAIEISPDKPNSSHPHSPSFRPTETPTLRSLPKRDPIDIILNENPAPIRDRMPGLEKNLAAVIDKALVRNPKDRFPDAGKLLTLLPKPRP